jgi:hypothetical protein
MLHIQSKIWYPSNEKLNNTMSHTDGARNVGIRHQENKKHDEHYAFFTQKKRKKTILSSYFSVYVAFLSQTRTQIVMK